MSFISRKQGKVGGVSVQGGGSQLSAQGWGWGLGERPQRTINVRIEELELCRVLARSPSKK